jgi:hypothetical protein
MIGITLFFCMIFSYRLELSLTLNPWIFMKLFITLSILLTCSIFSTHKLIDWNDPDNIKGELFVYATVRSGSTWTCRVLQLLTDRPMNYTDIPSIPGPSLYGRKLDMNKPHIYKSCNSAKRMQKIDQDKNKLILILRNYKECILRQLKSSYVNNKNPQKELLKLVEKNEGLFRSYMEKIEVFESWKNPETKYLVYYEDLIINPEKVITRLLEFVGDDPSNLDEVIDNYDYFKQKSLESYNRGHKLVGTSSYGDKALHHSKKISKSLLQKIDNSANEQYPRLFNKYLLRYKEK